MNVQWGSKTCGSRGLRIPKAVLTAACCLAPTGCPEAGVQNAILSLIPSPPPHQIAGGESTHVYFVPGQGSGAPLTTLFGQQPEAHDLFALDLASLEHELVLADIPALGSDIVASERFVAWVDRTENAVILRDLHGGAESRHMEGLVGGPERRFQLRALRDRYLVARRSSVTQAMGMDPFEFVVLDLETGTETIVGNGWLYGGFAVSGEQFALMNNLETNVQLLGLELSTNIDLVNLLTGERKTIAPNIRVNGHDGGDLFVTARMLVWQQFAEEGFQTEVIAYDLDADRRTTLAQDLKPDDGTAWLRGVTDGRLLIEKRIGEPLLGEVVSLEIRSFTGETTTLHRFPNTRKRAWAYEADPRLIGDFVVWTDPITGEFLVYDTTSGKKRRFDPSVG